MITRRPHLLELPLADAMRVLNGGEAAVIVTMSQGQWDVLLSAAYAQGFLLLELDDDETPVRAFQQKTTE